MSQGSVQARIEKTPRLFDLLLKVLGNKVVTSRWTVDSWITSGCSSWLLCVLCFLPQMRNKKLDAALWPYFIFTAESVCRCKPDWSRPELKWHENNCLKGNMKSCHKASLQTCDVATLTANVLMKFRTHLGKKARSFSQVLNPNPDLFFYF